MKYVKQLMIILSFSFLGEIINYILPLSIPTSIYGMVLLFITLCTKIVKLEQIEEAGEYLLSIMLIFFVPTAVGIMETFFEYQNSMLQIILIIILSTIIVLSVTGLVSQFVVKITSKSGKSKNIEGDVKNNE